jgi:hypothetical protein
MHGNGRAGQSMVWHGMAWHGIIRGAIESESRGWHVYDHSMDFLDGSSDVARMLALVRGLERGGVE